MANLSIYKNLLFFFKQDRIDENGLKLTALELAYLFPKIYLDLDFQRWMRWSSIRGKEFTISVCKGIGNVEIKLVSIKDAIQYSKEISDIESLKYFTMLQSNGYEYVSLDGNSRSTWITLFVLGFTPLVVNSIKGPKTDMHNGTYDLKLDWESKWLPQSEKFTETIAFMTRRAKNNVETPPSFALYQIKDEETIRKQNFCKYTNGVKKEELSDEDIESLIQMYNYYTKNIVFSVEVWKKIRKNEMNELFINFNKNESIVRQDIRNALDVGMSYSVRSMKKILKECLENQMSITDIQSRKHHQMVGMCMLYDKHETELKRGTAFNATSALDKFWIETRPNSFTSKEIQIWDIFVKLASLQNNSLNSTSLFLDIFAISRWLVHNNIATSLIDNDIDMNGDNVGWEKVMRLHSEWMNEQFNKGSIFKVSNGKGDWTAYRNGIKFFTYKDETGNVEWSQSLEDFLLTNKEKAGFISKNKRENVNKYEIRLALWIKQSETDPLTNMKIPFTEICNTDRNSGYEVDHMIALDNGGTNDFDNLQLTSGKINAQKGTKINYIEQLEKI
jgi:hypothetical protein